MIQVPIENVYKYPTYPRTFLKVASFLSSWLLKLRLSELVGTHRELLLVVLGDELWGGLSSLSRQNLIGKQI